MVIDGIETAELKDGRWIAYLSGMVVTPLAYGDSEKDAISRIKRYQKKWPFKDDLIC